MVKQFNYEIGKIGERKAWEYLAKKGYKLVEQNFHTRFGEIDLICVNQNKLIFVEVKLKIGDAYGNPEEMISENKITQVQRTAETFLQKNPEYAQKYSCFQIDAVAIVLNDDKTVARINHYENIGFDL
jgi:putative endonuclease